MTGNEEEDRSLLDEWQEIIEDFENGFDIHKIKADNVRSCKLDLERRLCVLEKDIQKEKEFMREKADIMGSLHADREREIHHNAFADALEFFERKLYEVFGKPQQKDREGET